MTKFQPSVLSYARSLQVGKGLFYGIVTTEDKKEIKLPVLVEELTIRGTQSSHSAGKGFYDENPDKPNIQRIESASLPHQAEIFECQFSLIVDSNSISPHTCTDEKFIACMKELTDTYQKKKGFEFLANRYLGQIINASWLWRNKHADDLTVKISIKNRPNFSPEGKDTGEFVLDLPLASESRRFLYLLKKEFAAALSGEKPMLRLEISARGKIGFGQEIFPSQEFSERDRTKTEVGRILAKTKLATGEQQACLHPQKIGNALRTIDTWYSAKDSPVPLPVEPYGVDFKTQIAMRTGKNLKIDLYTYLENLTELLEKTKEAETAEDLPGDVHFVVACLIRGGVFSFTSEEKAAAKKKKQEEKDAKKLDKITKKKAVIEDEEEDEEE